MLAKAGLIWLAISVLAVLNGILRESGLRKIVSEPLAHVTSTLILGIAVIFVAIASIGWIGVTSLGVAWGIGAFWLVLTLAFEFLAGHYAFGNPWNKILADYNVFRGRVWLLVPFCVLFAPPLAYRGVETKWAVPYCASLAIASAVLLLAVSRRSWARWSIVAMFAYAAFYNTWLGLTHPTEYQNFATLALIPWYADFIRGPFLANDSAMIVTIAAGQALSAIGLGLGGRWTPFGAAGVCLFLLGIAPFGVGSAFPFSIIVSLATLILVGPAPESAPELN